MRHEDSGIAHQISQLTASRSDGSVHCQIISYGAAHQQPAEVSGFSLRLDPDSRIAVLPVACNSREASYAPATPARTGSTARSTPAHQKQGPGPSGGWAGQANGTPKNSAAGQAEQRYYWRKSLRDVIFPKSN